ncbi:U1 small nuclear ribonucleoprotein 70 kDa [Halotydeus destructor]|nr:U1 small nuclear ribonucleoprotein 70 kDa [Halotydeus destructor]
MTQFLPPNLLALFAPRDPVKYLPPTEKLPFEKRTRGYAGVASFMDLFEDPKDTPPPKKIETRDERLERKKRERAEQAAYRLEQGIALWDPQINANSTSDPFKTLFVARVNHDSSESKLRREFETYGTVKKVGLVNDKVTGKPRGYAFVEYEHERDMHAAYKHADGKKIDGRRVLVDVERGRTVKGWLPRRLGGGLGGTRRGGPDENARHSGRDDDRADNDRDRNSRQERSRDGDRGDRRRSRSRDKDRERRKRDRSRSPRIREEREKEGRGSERDRGADRERRSDRDRGDRDRTGGRDRDRGDRGDRDRSDRKKDRAERSERPPSIGEYA